MRDHLVRRPIVPRRPSAAPLHVSVEAHIEAAVGSPYYYYY